MFDFDILPDVGEGAKAARQVKAPFRHLALIGNALPRKCGLATYTSHVADALRSLYPEMQLDHYAMDDGSGDFYPDPIITIDAEIARCLSRGGRADRGQRRGSHLASA